jgi:hypothetical protein
MLQSAHDAWWDVQDLWLSSMEAGTSPDEVSTPVRDQLSAIAASGGEGGAGAAAWLAALGAQLEPSILLPSKTRSFQPEEGSFAAVAGFILKAIPNPTKGEAVVAYELPEGAERSELELFDATGRRIWQKRLSRSTGLEDLPAALLLPGMYQVVVRADGFVFGTTKLVVIR